MANTTNFGWETPDDTDLVKDGAAAMRTLGNAIDTSFVDLKGGTTGQVLAKNSNTDLDFTWTNGGDITEVAAGVGISGGGTTGSVTITNSMATAIDAKGDLIVGTGADTFSRLAVGTTNGHTLQVDSSTATGLRWAANASAGKSYTLLNTGGTALTGASTITISGISAQDNLFVLIQDASNTNGAGNVSIQFNGDTGNNYRQTYNVIIQGAGYDTNNYFSQNVLTSLFPIARQGGNANNRVNAYFAVAGANGSGLKTFQSVGGDDNTTGRDGRMIWLGGTWNNSASITSISIISANGNFDNGTVFVYGAA